MYEQYKKEYNLDSKTEFSYKYVVSAPLKYDSNGKDLGYYDLEYDEMKNDSDLYEYYKEVKTIMNEWKQYLPDYVKEDARSENYIFRAKSDLLEAFNSYGLKSFWNQLSDKIKDGFVTEFQNEYVQEVDAEGKPVKNIPISTLRNIDLEKAKIEGKLKRDELDKEKGKKGLSESQIKILKDKLNELETSYTIDPSKSIEVFLAMATNYKFLSDIQNQVEAANTVIQQARQINLDGTFDDARNVKERLQYFIDANLYNERTEIEGQHKENKDFEDNIFETKDLLGLTSEKKKLAKELSKKIKNLKPKAEELFLKKQEEELAEEEQDEIEDYMKLVEEYRLLDGKRFTWSKLGDKLIEWNALKTFGLNPFSPVANVTFGMISTFIEASGGQHFNVKQALDGFTTMLNSTASYLSFGKIKTLKNDKITSVMDKFGIVEDSVDIKYGRNRLAETKTSKTLNPYNWMRSSDKFMKGVSVIAIMKNKNNKFNKNLKDINNNPITLWEAFDEKGNWKNELFSDEINSQWSDSFINGNGEKLTEFKQYLAQVEMSMHGNFDRTRPVLGKKYIVGRLVGQFKLSWLAEGFKQRFANKYYDSILDEEVEGRYKTFQRLLTENDDLNSNYFKSILKLLIKADSVENLTELDKANLKKIKADLLFYTSFMMLMILLKSWFDDDDDDKIDNGIGKILYNQLTQAQTDISFYLSPEVFKTFTGNLVPVMSIYTDLAKTNRALFKYIDTNDDEDLDRFWKKLFKNFPFSRSIMTFENRSEKLMEDYIER